MSIKSLVVIILVICYMPSCAQNSRKESNSLILPVFLDSITFVKDVKGDKQFVDIFELLRKDNEHATYVYNFKISSLGKVIPKDLERERLFKPINVFIKRTFNKYRWEPAYDKGCSQCKKTAYGLLYINFIPVNGVIQLQIVMSDGSIGKNVDSPVIYDERIEIN